MFASTEPRHGYHHPSQGYGVPESVYNPLYSTINSAMNTGGHAANSAGQSLRATQSPPPRPQFPKLEPVHLPEATTVQDFVSMNESFIATDLPENSPFAHARTEEKEKSDSLFPGYPYPENHHWHQTFKITEIKQIGPKKQRLACFFCRSRKIACATRAVDDESQGRPCEQCERRGFECKYPKDSKRGQHNRMRGLPAPKSS
ncbi:hypothetical protein B0H14DRAFT_2783661 [Mycena olivaceomarginata]|nr:hypothetical protein B0H14DRAFT_2783661 [Mycena olivaceomarginata]